MGFSLHGAAWTAVESLQSADLKLTATNAALLLEGSDSLESGFLPPPSPHFVSNTLHPETLESSMFLNLDINLSSRLSLGAKLSASICEIPISGCLSTQNVLITL